MATQSLTAGTGADLRFGSFARIAGLCGVINGCVGLLYALSFVVFGSVLWSSIFLMLGGLLSSAVLVALYDCVREADPAWSTWALVVSMAGAAGALIHGGYDLANTLHPPMMANADLPNAVDPRGLLTFGVAGLGLLAFAGLIHRSGRFSGALGNMGYMLGTLLIVIYIARLIVLNPANPLLLVPMLLTGFIVNPAWNIWLGIVLWRSRRS